MRGILHADRQRIADVDQPSGSGQCISVNSTSAEAFSCGTSAVWIHKAMRSPQGQWCSHGLPVYRVGSLHTRMEIHKPHAGIFWYQCPANMQTRDLLRRRSSYDTVWPSALHVPTQRVFSHLCNPSSSLDLRAKHLKRISYCSIRILTNSLMFFILLHALHGLFAC